MLKRFFPLLSVFFFIFSCAHKNKNVADATYKPVADSTESKFFFPVTAFILGELRQLDSLPVTPLKIITADNKTDSIWLKRGDIRRFAIPFTTPLIDSNNLSAFFKQTSFLDQTINAVTLNYAPQIKLPDSLQLQNWDVYIDPKSGLVQRIYLVKKIQDHNSFITQQLTWKANKWCNITSIIEEQGKQTLIKQEKLIWDFTE